MVQKKLTKKMLKLKTTLTLMKSGNKWSAEKILIKSLKKLQSIKRKKSFIKLFKLALVNVSPSFYVKKLKRRNKLFKEFPFLLTNKLKVHYGLKNAIKTAKTPVIKNSFYISVATEYIKSSTKKSTSFENKNQIHKTSFLNRKFINYRWF